MRSLNPTYWKTFLQLTSCSTDDETQLSQSNILEDLSSTEMVHLGTTYEIVSIHHTGRPFFNTLKKPVLYNISEGLNPIYWKTFLQLDSLAVLNVSQEKSQSNILEDLSSTFGHMEPANVFESQSNILEDLSSTPC